MAERTGFEPSRSFIPELQRTHEQAALDEDAVYGWRLVAIRLRARVEREGGASHNSFADADDESAGGHLQHPSKLRSSASANLFLRYAAPYNQLGDRQRRCRRDNHRNE